MALRRLAEATSAAGVSAEEQTTEGRCYPMRFESLLRRVIDGGATVVLDEFQNARGLGLVSPVKSVIDGIPINRRSPLGGACGKLFLTGSHQQRMFELFRDDQPLYGRIDEGIRLRQWGLKTVLEMAGEQGFLRYPSRLLTMCTAFGGMPGTWETFVTGGSPERDLGAWADDGTWRREFIAATMRSLQEEPMDRWDHAKFIELSPENRAVLDEIARSRGGRTAARIRGQLKMSGEDVRRALETLEEHLEFVTPSWNFMGSEARWRLSDNSTLFQLRVLGEGQPPAKARPGAAARQERRLESIEGSAFERMAASWLSEMEGVTWHGCGVWLPGLADIDVMALQEGADGRTLVMGGCKRNPETHHPARLERQFEQFLDAGAEDKELRELRTLPRRRLLVSPVFPPEARDRFSKSGFECVDTLDMARTLGADLDPDLETEMKAKGRANITPIPDP